MNYESVFFNLKNNTKIGHSVNRPITVEDLEKLNRTTSWPLKQFRARWRSTEGARDSMPFAWSASREGTLAFSV